MRKLTVSAVQFDVKLGDIVENAKRAASLIERAGDRGSDLIVLPEMWPVGFDFKAINSASGDYLDDILGLMGDLAKKFKTHIVGGTVAEKIEDRVYNMSPLIGPSGDIIGKYRKVHLFDEIGERDHFTPGSEPGYFETGAAKLGIAICYDLRFPELFRSLALQGSEIICLPAQFPNPRLEHWETLLRARAIENQLFMVGVNRVGRTGKVDFFGCSMIVGPYGEIIEASDDAEDVITEAIDLDKMYEIRELLPSLSRRRPEAYSIGRESFAPDVPIYPKKEFRDEPFRFKNTIHPMKNRE